MSELASKREQLQLTSVSRILDTDPRVVDRILRHRESARRGARDPFEPRAPPGADSRSGAQCRTSQAGQPDAGQAPVWWRCVRAPAQQTQESGMTANGRTETGLSAADSATIRCLPRLLPRIRSWLLRLPHAPPNGNPYKHTSERGIQVSGSIGRRPGARALPK
jgi:hypothetical protein